MMEGRFHSQRKSQIQVKNKSKNFKNMNITNISVSMRQTNKKIAAQSVNEPKKMIKRRNRLRGNFNIFGSQMVKERVIQPEDLSYGGSDSQKLVKNPIISKFKKSKLSHEKPSHQIGNTFPTLIAQGMYIKRQNKEEFEIKKLHEIVLNLKKNRESSEKPQYKKTLKLYKKKIRQILTGNHDFIDAYIGENLRFLDPDSNAFSRQLENKKLIDKVAITGVQIEDSEIQDMMVFEHISQRKNIAGKFRLFLLIPTTTTTIITTKSSSNSNRGLKSV